MSFHFILRIAFIWFIKRVNNFFINKFHRCKFGFIFLDFINLFTGSSFFQWFLSLRIQFVTSEIICWFGLWFFIGEFIKGISVMFTIWFVGQCLSFKGLGIIFFWLIKGVFYIFCFELFFFRRLNLFFHNFTHDFTKRIGMVINLFVRYLRYSRFVKGINFNWFLNHLFHGRCIHFIKGVIVFLLC